MRSQMLHDRGGRVDSGEGRDIIQRGGISGQGCQAWSSQVILVDSFEGGHDAWETFRLQKHDFLI